MSFSNPNEASQSAHPCQLWIEYKSKKKDFEYWDKEIINHDGSKGAKAYIGSNPIFIYLDHTFCVTGYNQPKKFSLRSNELKIAGTKEAWAGATFKVESMPKEAMVIKLTNTITLTAIEGAWADIKDLVSSQQGKLTINTYVALKVNGELKLACIKFSGGTFGHFKAFYDKHKGSAMYAKPIKIIDHVSETKGDNTYNVPVFGFVDAPITPETAAKCIEMDKQLQDFLATKVTASEPAAQAAQPQLTGTAYEASMQANAPTTDTELEQTFGEIPQTGKAGAMQPNQSFDMTVDDDLPF